MHNHPSPLTVDGNPSESRPLLSLAMIVRDGGQYLSSLLKAAHDWVDEIVIGDTGSSDGSPSMARLLGARVLEITWRDDFAAARNEVLDACKGRWILVMDDDEQLAPDSWAQLRQWVLHNDEAHRPLAGTMVTRNYLEEHHQRRGWQLVPDVDPYGLSAGPPAAGFVSTSKIRLFPRDERVRFRDRLHETVEASVVEAGIPICELEWPIHHFGMLDPDPDKAERYLGLARLKTTDRPLSPQGWTELADCAIACGRYTEALDAIDRALILEPSDPETRLTAGWLLREMGRLEQADHQLAAVAGSTGLTDKQVAEICHLRAQIAMHREQIEAAAPLLGMALRLFPDNGHYLNTLGALHLQAGRGEPARRALEKARNLLPGSPEPLLNLGLMYEAAGHPDLAIRHLTTVLEITPNSPAAAAAMARLQGSLNS